MVQRPFQLGCTFLSILGILLVHSSLVFGQLPNPVLNTVFPPGGQVGKTVEVTVAGSQLTGLTTLHFNHSEISCEPIAKTKNQFRVTISEKVSPGLYEIRAVCQNGLSSPRTFFVGNRTDLLESTPTESTNQEQSVPLNVSINGRIEKKGDQDFYQFSAKQGDRVVIECWAGRIDSQLRAILELSDSNGRRLAINRGYFGVDPLIDFHVPADGTYIVKLFDLVHSGSADHFYRLDIDTGPRVAFAIPAVIEKEKNSKVTLYGWNLNSEPSLARKTTLKKQSIADLENNSPTRNDKKSQTKIDDVPASFSTQGQFDRMVVSIKPPQGQNVDALRLRSSQVTVDGFAYHHPGSHAPILLGLTDLPVGISQPEINRVETAQQLSIPCEVTGQLIAGEEQDWYTIQAKRGEVLWIEGFSDRLNSPVDLDISILDLSGKKELAHFGDEINNLGRQHFPSNHLDPSGKWLVPADGRYFLVVRNLIGGLDDDPRRLYHFSIRRQEPDFYLAIVPRRDDPASLNVSRNGRTLFDILAFRRRGLNDSIRVSAKSLPAGIECPDIWFGPGVDRAPLTISADHNASDLIGTLHLEGHAESTNSHKVSGSTIVRKGVPNGMARITSVIPMAVRGNAEIRITADGHETRKHNLYGELTVRHSPGSILDVAVHVEREIADFAAPVELIGVGVPSGIKNQIATIPAGKNKGYISFYLPPSLPVGTYTLAIQANTTVPVPSKGDVQKTKPITLFSNAVTFEVKPAAFVVEIDPYAPKTIKRGEITQVKYTVKRVNGFISKIHTEMTAPDEVIGLRARGSSSVGQSESGTLQIIANDDAPLGRQPFIRFYAVGVIEDEAVYHGSYFLNLEIVE